MHPIGMVCRGCFHFLPLSSAKSSEQLQTKACGIILGMTALHKHFGNHFY